MIPVPPGSRAIPARAVVALLMVAFAAFIAVGCGETVIDDAKAEGAIQSNLEKTLHEKITSVDCPSGEKVDPGKTFDCTVDFSNGKQATATLKILNKEADVSLVGLKPNK